LTTIGAKALCLFADLIDRADLGFFSECPDPGLAMIRASGCEDQESLTQCVQELRDAFTEENALFQAA
jgi:hypothetical protein